MVGMMTVGEACLLGLVQGVTEFLPVSSSGHLAVLHRFLSPLSPEQTAAIDVALHVGTLIAVIAYFWRDLFGMAAALFAPATSGWRFRWIWLLGLATVPAAVVGLTLKDRIVASFGSMETVGVCFLVTGTLLFLASAVRGADGDENDVGAGSAVVVGCFQAIALFPGVSRSGSTIAGGIFARIRPDVSARFSFLLGIPAIVGAEVSELSALSALGPDARVPVLAGVVVAAVSGVIAIWTVLRLVEAGRLHYFAYYTWALGVAVLVGTALFGL
jgi:undecaprenyl-diphosphatase